MLEFHAAKRFLHQQSALVDFGTFAFGEENLSAILTEAARICAQSLDVSFAMICRYRPEENDLLVVAGCGWQTGVIGSVLSKADVRSTQARALATGKPVIVKDLSTKGSFALPASYAGHGIVSTACVQIEGKTGPWGILEVDSAERREFDDHDIVFLDRLANVIAEAVKNAERMVALHDALAAMNALLGEKDALLVERSRNEIRMRELQAHFLHVSRMNAMGHMTAAIAHELNQPLAAITNYLSAAELTLAKAEFGPATLDRVQGMIGKARGQTLRAGEVIRTLKDIVEKRESCQVAADIGVIVRETLALVTFAATDANISLKLELDAGIPPVCIDKIQIQQLLINLIRNGIEAMTDGEERILTLTTSLGDPGFADVTVCDTGPGLPPDVLARLFQPFTSTKIDGMGLGLMICQSLAEANGGRIYRLADHAKGTAFRFSVPLVAGLTKIEPASSSLARTG